jgi:DNA-binding NtrC family response regulator
MATARVMILEGSNGQPCFFKETLLTQGLADQVDSVNRVDQTIGRLHHHPDTYDLVVINLAEAWEQGIQLGSWFSQQPSSCPVILISPRQSSKTLSNTPFVTMPVPVSPYDFVKNVQAALQPVSH